MKKVQLEKEDSFENICQLPDIDVYECEEILGRQNRENTREYLDREYSIMRFLSGALAASLVVFSLSKMYEAWPTQDGQMQNESLNEENEEVICLLAIALLAGIALIKRKTDLESINLKTSKFVEQITPSEFKKQQKSFTRYEVSKLEQSKEYLKYEQQKQKRIEDDFLTREAATISKLENIKVDSEELEGIILKIDEEQRKRAPPIQNGEKKGGDSIRSSIEPIINGGPHKVNKQATKRVSKKNQDDQLSFSYNSDEFR